MFDAHYYHTPYCAAAVDIITAIISRVSDMRILPPYAVILLMHIFIGAPHVNMLP